MTSHSDFLPARVLAVDLATGNITAPYATERPPQAYSRVHALACLGDQPIGFVDLRDINGANEEAIVEGARQQAWRSFSPELKRGFAEAQLPQPESAADLSSFQPLAALEIVPSTSPLITIVISTLDNDEAVMDCAERILDSAYQNLDVVVVDNSGDGEPLQSKMAQRFADESRVRHVLEPRRGLSRARNKGAEVALGKYIVFTDDDVVVDRHWVSNIVDTFQKFPDAGCVTGSIIPAELETPSQDWLEQFGGFNKGFSTQVFDLDQNSRPEPLYPYDSGRFGSGANMAFDRAALDALGGFANDLGAGTPAWGGEDIDILRRTVTSGFTLVYEPKALMWHRHRRSYEALRKQMFRYGVGLSATVFKWIIESPTTGKEVLRRLPNGVIHVLGPSSKKNAAKVETYPKILTWLEIAGLLMGPASYLRSRRHCQRIDRLFTSRH